VHWPYRASKPGPDGRRKPAGRFREAIQPTSRAPGRESRHPAGGHAAAGVKAFPKHGAGPKTRPASTRGLATLPRPKPWARTGGGLEKMSWPRTRLESAARLPGGERRPESRPSAPPPHAAPGLGGGPTKMTGEDSGSDGLARSFAGSERPAGPARRQRWNTWRRLADPREQPQPPPVNPGRALAASLRPGAGRRRARGAGATAIFDAHVNRWNCRRSAFTLRSGRPAFGPGMGGPITKSKKLNHEDATRQGGRTGERREGLRGWVMG